MRAGEPGSSVFVVVEGLLRVRVPTSDGQIIEGDDLHPGSIFGEFSLLTGAPRSATVVPFTDSVVYEIGKVDLQPILAECPQLAEELSEILAERQSRSRELASHGLSDRPHSHSTRSAILDTLRAFFGLPDNE